MKTVRRKAAKRTPAKRYPPIPLEVAAPGGLVAIEVVDTLDEKSDEIEMGHYHLVDRTIRIRERMKREQQWRVLLHELVHVWLTDSGVSAGLAHDAEEAVCDAIATGLMSCRVKIGG